MPGAPLWGRGRTGPSLKGEMSVLQPATPAARSAAAARPDRARERDGSSNLRMDKLTHTDDERVKHPGSKQSFKANAGATLTAPGHNGYDLRLTARAPAPAAPARTARR